jgi:hypothetical protein
MKNGLKVGTIIGQKHTYDGTQAFLNDRKPPGSFINLVSFHADPHSNTDPDPGQPNQWGSMQIQIHNTGSLIVHTSLYT